MNRSFELDLRQLAVNIRTTLAEAQIAAQPQGAQGTLRDRLVDLDKKLQDITNLVSSSNAQIHQAKMEGREADAKAKNAKRIIQDARVALKVRHILLKWKFAFILPISPVLNNIYLGHKY